MRPVRPRCMPLAPSIRAPWACGTWGCAWTRKPVCRPPHAQGPDLGGPTGQTGPGGTRVHPARVPCTSGRGLIRGRAQSTPPRPRANGRSNALPCWRLSLRRLPHTSRRGMWCSIISRRHTGKQVQAWLTKPPRFVFHVPPGHCSWEEPGGAMVFHLAAQTLADRRCCGQETSGRTLDGLCWPNGMHRPLRVNGPPNRWPK